MHRILGAVLLALVVSGCGSDSGERADDPATDPATSESASQSASPPPAALPAPLPRGLTVATTGEQPCRHPRKVPLDRAIGSGGVWMPTDELTRQDDLVAAWQCAPDLPILLWEDVAILFVPERPPGSPKAFLDDASERLDGRVDSALGVPALALDAEGQRPAEVDLVMGDTHIVLLGIGEDAASADELLRVAGSMAPLH